MKIIQGVDQGGDAWLRIRLGIPTASNFHRIVTRVKCELSAQAKDYALQLVAERLLRSPTETAGGFHWMERGKELEAHAVRQYEFANDVTTVPVTFITTDDGRIGCSPDRLVAGDKAAAKLGLEVKCPSPPVHLEYLAAAAGITVGVKPSAKPKPPKKGAAPEIVPAEPQPLWVFTADDYKPQVQGQIYIAEFDRADLYSFHERMPAATVRTYRDDAYIEKLAAALAAFTEQLDSLTEQALKLGVYQAAAEKAPEASRAARELAMIAEQGFGG